jgi:hypothetical protein
LTRWEARRDLQSAQHRFRMQSSLARAYAVLGDRENALTCLEKSYQERDFGLVLVGLIETYAPLRSDPRYINIRRKMNLPD